MATRWRCPPDSWVGRAFGGLRARRDEGRPGLVASVGWVDSGVEETVRHVLQDGRVFREEELLENEADLRGPQRGEFSIRHGCYVEAGDAHRPATRPVERAHEVQQRVLPDPDGPTTATSSPGCTVKLMPCNA